MGDALKRLQRGLAASSSSLPSSFQEWLPSVLAAVSWESVRDALRQQSHLPEQMKDLSSPSDIEQAELEERQLRYAQEILTR
jgi:hypothetical protein